MLTFKEDRAQQAYDAALLLPPRPAPDWTAAIAAVERTGQGPESDTTYDFPPAQIQEWFGGINRQIDTRTALLASRQLFALHADLLVRANFEADTAARTFARKGKDGPTVALSKALVEIAQASSKIRKNLSEIRWELLYRRMNGERHQHLENLHYELHAAFLYGLARRSLFDVSRPDSSIADLRQSGEVGPTASLAPTWLEDALTVFGDAGFASIGTVQLARMESDRAYATSGMRQDYVLGLMRVWELATGTRPAVMERDDQLAQGRFSGFQLFHQTVCGHSAGLAIKSWIPDHKVASGKLRRAATKRLREMGLNPVPGATSLRRYLKGYQSDPSAQG